MFVLGLGLLEILPHTRKSCVKGEKGDGEYIHSQHLRATSPLDVKSVGRAALEFEGK